VVSATRLSASNCTFVKSDFGLLVCWFVICSPYMSPFCTRTMSKNILYICQSSGPFGFENGYSI